MFGVVFLLALDSSTVYSQADILNFEFLNFYIPFTKSASFCVQIVKIFVCNCYVSLERGKLP